ncbi:MAG: hypothetical protein HW387_12 [Parachlamydiales bacterium]|nr:hypothetical protein [Parachlamydiales bacterium]
MRWLRLALIAAIVLAIPATLKRLTHSFHIERLFVDLPVKMSQPEASDEIRQILSQDFEYLGRGSQAFVFSSADRKYVLKLFLFDSPSRSLIRRFFYRSEEMPMAVKVLQACQIADRLASNETGLVYVHPEPTQKNLPVVRLYGPAWHRSMIELDRYRFAIQRLARPLKQVLLEAYLANDRERFGCLVSDLLSLLSKRIALGIYNTDPTLFDNFGFIDDRAVEIDFGNYILIDEHCDRSRDQYEKARYTSQLLEWTRINAPEWIEDVVQLIDSSS